MCPHARCPDHFYTVIILYQSKFTLETQINLLKFKYWMPTFCRWVNTETTESSLAAQHNDRSFLWYFLPNWSQDLILMLLGNDASFLCVVNLLHCYVWCKILRFELKSEFVHLVFLNWDSVRLRFVIDEVCSMYCRPTVCVNSLPGG